ncbi:MAG: xanthine dehydrogenase family protein molybdopterin-binding subunit [Sandaracinaceae bacterium]|nr:xanthine dehydrogenase family protein molybdopterin-binding subunit [Sandaracinaceae bacterium]
MKIVGTSKPRVDGAAKVTGQARYADDLALPRMLHARILRSPHAHARIVAIDLAPARATPGVLAAIVGEDLPVAYGILPWTEDEYPLAIGRALYVGDGVAAVAAIDERTAIAACAAVRVEWEKLPAVLSPAEALAHPEIKVNEHAKDGNVSKQVDLSFGPVDENLERAAAVIEGEFHFEGTTHAALEPHCAVASWEPRGELTVWSSTQVPHYLHRALAKVLQLPEDRIRVVQPAVGGAFGGKSEPFDLEFCAAKLSMLTGRPVKIRYTREEVFYAHRGRHPMHMRFRTAADAEGKLLAVDSSILIDGGAHSSFGLVTTYYSGQLLGAPYELPAYRFHSTRVFTNKPACGPKRGHGSVQPRFAIECQLDELAERLEIDPIELRRRNAMGSDETTINGQRVGSNGFLQCLDAVERASGWKEKFGKLPRGRGLGVAGSTYISGTAYPIYPNEMPQSGVSVKLDRSGQVLVTSGVSEIGQGVETVLAYIAVEELGCELAAVRVITGDTLLCPVDLGAYSSRVTFMAGTAAIEACRAMRAHLVEAAAKALECDPSEIELAGGRASARGRELSFREVARLAESAKGTLVTAGGYRTRKVGGEYRGGSIGASPAYSFTAHVAEVSVDERSGVVTVENIWVAHDCGRALHPIHVMGQMEGSAYMGFGEALMESHTFHANGLHRGPSLLDYKLPTTLDTPAVHASIVEANEPGGPYGAKEVGEGPLHPSIPAIANAIHDAVGIRLRALPFSPDRVRAALLAKGGG